MVAIPICRANPRVGSFWYNMSALRFISVADGGVGQSICVGKRSEEVV